MSEPPISETPTSVNPPDTPEEEKDPLSAAIEELATGEKKEKVEKSKIHSST